MANLNKVMLIGNLTRDPEIKYTPKGTAVCDAGLAINRVYNTEGGERREETTFIDVTFWGRTAEVVSQYTKKGSPLFVEGRLQLDSWEDKQSGQKRSKLRVVGEGIQLLGSRPSGAGGGAGSSAEAETPRPATSRPTPPPRQEPPPPAEDDDVPF